MASALVPARVRPRLRSVIAAGILATACGGNVPDSVSDSDPPPPTPPGGGGVATDTVLTLAWLPNAETVEGYIVYHGPTPDTAEDLAVDLPVDALADDQAPSVSFNAGTDLSLRHGDSVCFRLRAYNADLLSDWSEAACATI